MRRQLTASDLDLVNLILARDPALAEALTGKLMALETALGPVVASPPPAVPASPKRPVDTEPVLHGNAPKLSNDVRTMLRRKGQGAAERVFCTVAEIAASDGSWERAEVDKAVKYLRDNGLIESNGKPARARAYAFKA